jgi:hypothetical protein
MLVVMWGEIIESPSFRLKKAGTGCVQIGVLLHQLDVKKEGPNVKETGRSYSPSGRMRKDKIR